MDTKQSMDNKPANWEYLPDTTTLAQYLERKDLIELSKCCKRYRKQLERQVFENLNLDNWRKNNQTIYGELEKSKNHKKILKYVKIDLGSKLKFGRKFSLSDEINYPFAKKFVKLFPNILTLRLCETSEDNRFSERSLRTVLKGMKHLEHVELNEIWGGIEEYKSKAQIFPKSLKSLKINDEWGIYCNDDNIMVYDTIDSTYENLYFLSITSNKMFQNLSCRMDNLKEVEIKGDGLDNTKLAKFLKSNPHLKKLNIYLEHYNEEIVNTILSFKYLEHLYISIGRRNEIQANILSSNHSIKFISISKFIPGPLAFQLINSCKISEVLEFDHYYHRDFDDIDWSKLARRINILKLFSSYVAHNTFKEIDTSRKFNQIHFKE
ncbi:hypothetical protein CONCODRAFT_7749, partial [Conidiobolus coronatus NRRL 28638]